MGRVTARFSVPVVGRSVGLLLLAFALLAGPVSAECSSCCPSPAERNLEIGSLGCCGGPCGVTLERPDSDRTISTVERHSSGLVVLSAVLTQPPYDLRGCALATSAFDLPPPATSPIT